MSKSTRVHLLSEQESFETNLRMLHYFISKKIDGKTFVSKPWQIRICEISRGIIDFLTGINGGQ